MLWRSDSAPFDLPPEALHRPMHSSVSDCSASFIYDPKQQVILYFECQEFK